MTETVRIAGYEVSRPATFIGEGLHFVTRSTMRGRPWLRFVLALNGQRYYVTAHRRKRDALEGWGGCYYRGSLLEHEART